jgi:hypothetical protein
MKHFSCRITLRFAIIIDPYRMTRLMKYRVQALYNEKENPGT